jgi:RNA-directed DNA polymerase
MASLTRFLAEKLKLKVNTAKSALARPWNRKFLGYSVTWHKVTRLRIEPVSLERLEERIRILFKGARGRSLSNIIQKLNPILR